MADQPEHWTGPRLCYDGCEQNNDPVTCGIPHRAKPWCIGNPHAPHNRLQDEANLAADRVRLSGVPFGARLCVHHGWVVGCSHLRAADDAREKAEVAKRRALAARPGPHVEYGRAGDRPSPFIWPGLRPKPAPPVRRFQRWSADVDAYLKMANWTLLVMTILFGVVCALGADGPPPPGAALTYGLVTTFATGGMTLAAYRTFRSRT